MAVEYQIGFPSEQQAEPESGSFFNSFPSKKFIVVVLILIVIIVVGLLFISKRSETPIPIASPSPSPIPVVSVSLPVMQIGADSFSQDDVDYLAKVYLSGKGEEDLSPSNQKKVRAIALERSVVIQEAKRNNLISISDNIFSANKNWREYNQTFEQAKEAVIAQEEQISVAGIFIFFYNQFPPDMGVEEAKKLTRGKMEAIRQKLVTGEIDLKQAAEIIKADSSLAEIDPIWDKNAYAEYKNRNRTRQVIGGITSVDNELLWSLDVGEYSPIILGYETGNLPEPNEAYWAVFQVLDKRGTGKPYLEWLKEAKENYAVQDL